MEIGSIRQQVADILTDWIGDKSNGLVFKPEGTTKRTGGSGPN